MSVWARCIACQTQFGNRRRDSPVPTGQPFGDDLVRTGVARNGIAKNSFSKVQCFWIKMNINHAVCERKSLSKGPQINVFAITSRPYLID